MRRTLTAVLVTALLPAAAAAQGAPGARIWAASDGTGEVRIFWLPEAAWPAGGWRLERVSPGAAEVLAEAIEPSLGPEALASLSAERAEVLRELVGRLRSSPADPGSQVELLRLATILAAVDPAAGHALGLRAMDASGAAGARTYRVTALGPHGEGLFSAESDAVDPLRPEAISGPPSDLRAEREEDSVRLLWAAPAGPGGIPLAGYRVARIGPDNKVLDLTPEPLIALAGPGPADSVFVDPTPPLEARVTYRVYGIDLLARSTPPAEVTLFVEDLLARRPPAGIEARTEDQTVVLEWRPNDSPHTAGVAVERSSFYDGPYEILTPEGLGPEVRRFEDARLPASGYYYRLRSFDVRRTVGEPSLPVLVTVRPADPPPPPAGLQAEAGRMGIRLTWEASPHPVARYLVQRRGEGSDRWSRANLEAVVEPRFDDRFGRQNGGAFSYRVLAETYDGSLSEPSVEVSVVLPDLVPPRPPRIVAASGAEGRSMIRFTPALPAGETSGFLVLRSSSPAEPGILIGEPLPETARQYEDPWARPAEEYWYRLVALDAAGNRSEPSHPVGVVVDLPPIPRPPAPLVERVTEPASYVALRFDAPPPGLYVIVQRRLGGETGWLEIGGPIREPEFQDLRPPRGVASEYRIVHEATSGARGEPSEGVPLDQG